MRSTNVGPLLLNTRIERWPLIEPFRITGYTFEAIEVLLVTLQKDGHTGRGEAAGVYFKSDKPVGMIQQVEALRRTIEAGVSRELLQTLLPPGGARNAVDCALWELEAKLQGVPVWQLAELQAPKALLTTFGCGADTPENMARVARAYKGARAVKLKLTGEPIDVERIHTVREALPDVWLAVDANQGFTQAFMHRLMPTLIEARVAMIEQPFAVGEEALLEGFQSPIPIAADESVHSSAQIPRLAGLFDVVNIKLDKCGGLSEGLAMARVARECGLDTMVGNMIGTSLAMAPAFLVGQMCRVVDLDGPLFLADDRAVTVQYDNGHLHCPETVWGR